MQNDLRKILDVLDRDIENAILRLFELLRMKSVSTDPAFTGDCLRTATACSDLLAELGFASDIHETPGHPMVLAHFIPKAPLSKLHLLFYGHYDVQPADPLDEWQSDPFEPILREDPEDGPIIVGRGASDDKGQLMTFLEALRAILKVSGDLPFKITVLLEGEEECGSPSLAAFLDQHSDQLRADLAIVCDTNQWDRHTPAITTMLRGLANIELTIWGPDRDLHSGFFGGPARNPLQVLCAILARTRDESGAVTIPGFYEGILEPDPLQIEQWNNLGFDAESFMASIGLGEAAGETDHSVLEQIWSRPTLEINGLHGGYGGPGVKTVIPARANAKISFRLVPGQNPKDVINNFKAFVCEQLPQDCQIEFSNEMGSAAIGFNPSSPPFQAAAKSLEAEFAKTPVMMGCGASIPIVSSFAHELGMNTMLIGFALNNDRIHSPNEKYNLSSFTQGTRAFARIINELAQLDPKQFPAASKHPGS
jgi:acetylornithine deacetylase/succinyl-diaminopimelate desuccinylase-like protein